jgi:DNA-binding transcriptional regulator YhcF (GntR family)
MNTITSMPQGISANYSFPTIKINVQIEPDKQCINTNVINQRCIVTSKDSSDHHGNSVIDAVYRSINKLPLDNNLTLSRKSQLHSIITNSSGNPDYLAINIYYDTLRSWYTPNKMKNVDGEIIHISKLKTKGIHLSYKELAKAHGCSSETIRRKLVKLEQLGLIQRSYKHKETVTTKSYNQLIIYVWKQTPYFYNRHGIEQSEVPALKPQTNHEYITEKYNIDYHSQIERIKAIESRGGIHKLVDTKELIEPFNKLKDRSRANFVKNSSHSFSIEKNPNTEPDNKIEWKDSENLKAEVKSDVEYDSTHDASITPHTTNGFLGSGKYLFEVLDHLTDEMCSQIRARCGKNYTDKTIREIAKAVSRSKKGAKAFFHHIKGFIAYLSKILTFEKRDPVKISGTNYYITANQTSEERAMREQEKYLTDIEYSLQVSPEWHLKKKLASVLERSKAYNLLTSYKSIEITKGRAVITLNRHTHLSKLDKELILSQIQATHEKIEGNGNYQPVESLEIITPNKPAALNALAQQDQISPKREGVWGKIRETFASYFGSEGDAIDKSWLSNFNASIDNRKKTIELQAPSRFIKDWVESNYLGYIEDAARVNGLEVQGIK